MAKTLAHKLEMETPEQQWESVSFVFLDHSRMRDLNSKTFAKHTTTDVISFSFAPTPPEHGASGECAVNIDAALEAGPTYDGPSLELARYLVHGILHIYGMTDATKEEQSAMRKMEDTWLGEIASRIDLTDLIEESNGA